MPDTQTTHESKTVAITSLKQAPAAHNPIQTRAKQRIMARMIRRLVIMSVMTILTMGWIFDSYLAPDMSNIQLSAKPAPPVPYLPPAWLDLPPMQRDYETVTLNSGDNLISILTDHNVDIGAAHLALTALTGKFDPHIVKPGQDIRIFWETSIDESYPQFAGFDFIPTPRQRIIVRRIEENNAPYYEAVMLDRPLKDRHFLTETLITSSVYEAARNAGIAPNLVVDLIHLFSYSIDFQRDIREGDHLNVFYTRRYDDNNRLAEEGDILYASITNRGKEIALWSFIHDDGSRGYYDKNGRGVQRLLMKTPIDGARLSSHFGPRRHPVLGYTRIHRGLDFAAPTGTPIFAAGDGKILQRRYYNGFGNYIRIQHRNGYQTAYAHLSHFARGVRVGASVRQGDTIGYVGMTGIATGPHLHYEVLRNGKHVNPHTTDLPPTKILNETGKAKLAAQRRKIDAQIHSLVAYGNMDSAYDRQEKFALIDTTSTAEEN